MKRLLIFALFLCVLLVSCADKTVVQNSSTYSDSESQEQSTANGVVGGEYVANIASKKYHTQFCGYAQLISEENMILTYDVPMLTDKGYTPCNYCIARTAE